MTTAVMETVITENAQAKAKIFEALDQSLGNDVWFYVHLGNYGNAVCTFINESNGEENCKFTLRFHRLFEELSYGAPSVKRVLLFELHFDSRIKSWQQFYMEMKENARAILGFASPVEYND